MNDIQLPWSFFNLHGLNQRTNLFPEGRSVYANHITAVDPTLLAITEPAVCLGMEGLLQQRHRKGVFPAY
ncbi:hypothetical protein ACNKHW_21740 [Shigella flexneri]